MIFQGKELRIGDKLVSQRHGEIEVNSLHRNRFTAVCEATSQTFEWEYTGQYSYVDEEGVDAKGVVFPSYVCPSGCGFHAYITLGGYGEAK